LVSIVQEDSILTNNPVATDVTCDGLCSEDLQFIMPTLPVENQFTLNILLDVDCDLKVKSLGEVLIILTANQTDEGVIGKSYSFQKELSEVVLYTYPYYGSGIEVIGLLKDRFIENENPLIRWRIKGFLELWLKEINWNINSDPELKNYFSNFIKEVIQKTKTHWGMALMSLLDVCNNQESNAKTELSSSLTYPTEHKKLRKKSTDHRKKKKKEIL